MTGLSTSFTRILSCAVFKPALPVLCAVTVRISSLFSDISASDRVLQDLINDTYACENNKTLNDIMKREFGFQGYIMSDWSAQHSTMSAVAGLDVRIASIV